MNRRRFLAATATAGAWSAAPSILRAQAPAAELRVGVIGLNDRGNNHVDDLLRAHGARLVALCDCDSAMLNKTNAKVEKAGLKVQLFTDFRKLLESNVIDAVTIATPNHTHCYIAIYAAAHGKPVYVEKPVSHNVWEGRMLAQAQKKYRVVIQHGFQRRSEKAWIDAFEWLNHDKPFGELKLARAICYKPRPSIGKVGGAKRPPSTLDYDLWSGPREMLPVMRERFHYDWHWQFPYGNGDMGNQAPHQLDVCRWAIGDPRSLPPVALSCGGRFGYVDDGQWANTQVVFLGYEPAPILVEVRGLPAKNMDYKGGMDSFHGEEVGNVLEYEGGVLVGNHTANCKAIDKDGKVVKEFHGEGYHIQTWIDSILSGHQPVHRAVENGHISSALAHVGNISWRLGEAASLRKVEDAFTFPAAADAIERMGVHLAANGVDLKTTPMLLGAKLEIADGAETFHGANAEKANPLLKDKYRKGWEITV